MPRKARSRTIELTRGKRTTGRKRNDNTAASRGVGRESPLSRSGVIGTTTPDLLRLVAVPLLAWAAVRDVRSRRVPSVAWVPLGALGAVLLCWEAWLAWRAGPLARSDLLVPAAVGFGLVVPIAYFTWWAGGFGGADARALFALALLFPTVPTYAIEIPPDTPPFPLEPGTIAAFPFTILANAVVVAACVPVALAVRNAAAGRLTPAMAVGRPVDWDALEETHGRLLETAEGPALRAGLDLDALRMYLRWRGLTVADLRADPDRYRDPATLPVEPDRPTDGAVGAGRSAPTGAAAGDGDRPARGPEATADDPWGAETFLDEIEGTAYGTSPETLREGLEVVRRRDRVWISPGMPFLVAVLVGLVIALVYGDLLVGLVA
ncbi:A24 family peptidase [Saliphagus infecundisoli]|uniref:A24 family peptidase C-terminal domain-containing protein n=1 Tax=Saliphagus infecundisoli TaxID=1849069 RepID=A0ABD5QKA7_9EURY|nr:A24 family peptidase [Saliphagus infecundisoli]